MVNEILKKDGVLSKVIPDYKPRSGQIKLANGINDCYITPTNFLANAPTGNGKSIAGLIPAILNRHTNRTIVSTATKSLQEQYKRDIEFLKTVFDFNYVVLKGRDNYLCKNKFEHSEIDQKAEISAWADETKTGDLEELSHLKLPLVVREKINSQSDQCENKDCPYKTTCFYKRALSKAQVSDVVVINHDLLSLHLMLGKRLIKPSIPEKSDVIIIDESHKLEDIVTKYLGYRLTYRGCAKLIKRIQNFYYNNYVDRIDKVSTDIRTVSNSLNNEFMSYVGKEGVNELFGANKKFEFQNIILAMENIKHDILQATEKLSTDEKLAKLGTLITSINSFIVMLEHFKDKNSPDKENFCYYVEHSEYVEEIKLVSLPINVGSELCKSLFKRNTKVLNGDVKSVVCMSATLCVDGEFDFFIDRVGVNKKYSDCDESCLKTMVIAETFDYKHQALLYVPKGIIEPKYGDSSNAFTRQISSEIEHLSKIVDGGILSLFTSYSEMDKTFDMVSTNRNKINQKMFSKMKALDEFKKDSNSILFATGTFWEGIDIRGKQCSCVTIDKLPFPSLSEPVVQARIDKLKRDNKNWFNGYYLPLMILTLKQGFGRLIRTEKDLGAVVIMDNRIVNKPYGKKVLNSLPNCLYTRDMKKVEVFFDVVKQKRKLRGN